MSWLVPTGRLRRRDWWLRYLLLLLVLGVVAPAVDTAWFPDSYPRLDRDSGISLLWPGPQQGGPVTVVSALVLLAPAVAAMVTRLHDRDHSAWWLLWNLLPGLGTFVLFVTVGLLGSRPEPNRYGPVPGHVAAQSR
ncbi:DUF805 domain-containing protein [Goekera deserti]|uniref:DUF805 domain-containing protein n=1 Tax=Goekera deserti TaxID=2497753 RepID=A0A7K3W9H6_9ACTN|nr:DUF805 domain-containing protein [Goekera deserti]NDI49467.1 DUF805 domain-containing protein [Goekera deserti]NEL52659.1 DUF805 domain-containing protein [Goekera deserti]